MAFGVNGVESLSLEAIERMESVEFIEGSNERDLNFLYEGQTRSLIEWQDIDAEDWLDLERWKNERAVKDQWPHWRVTLREQRLTEGVGRVLDCRGECRVYRGSGQTRARHRSGIVEGDEVRTIGDSYAWIFLYDGTMVRLAPESSITFQEMNVGRERIFHHARINQGNVAWISRIQALHEEINLRETDPIFFPLSLWEANIESIPREPLGGPEDGNFLPLIEERKKPHEIQVERLNERIKINNENLQNKDSHVFLVMPNGTVEGINPFVEFIVLPNAHSYFKQKLPGEHSLSLKEDEAGPKRMTLYYRGFENTETLETPIGEWIKMAADGRRTDVAESPERFAFGALLTRRIPSLFFAREIWLEKYGPGIFNFETPEELATNGYRLWDYRRYGEEERTDLDLRLDFLREYTRRLETTNLTVSRNFYNRVEAEGGEVPEGVYSDLYYKRAYENYIVDHWAVESHSRLRDPHQKTLHSMRRDFWKRVQTLKEQR